MDGAKAEINMQVECRCTNCGEWNRFQPLSAVHGNMKAVLSRDKTDKEWKVTAKCSRCDKLFDITSFAFV